MRYHAGMNSTSPTIDKRTPFARNSLQIKVGAPRGLTVETHYEMQREARMQDWTVGQLLEHMWAAYAEAHATPAPAPASSNGTHRKRA